VHSPADQEIRRLALSPTRPQVASGNKTGSLRSWDLNDGRQLWSVEANESERVTGLAFSADGDKLYCTFSGPLIEIRTAASGRLEGSWRGPQGPISDLALSADGRLLVTASETDHNAVVWEVAGRNEVCRLPPHEEIVYAVAIARAAGSSPPPRRTGQSVSGTFPRPGCGASWLVSAAGLVCMVTSEP
jgi:WD40 repeat protein